MPSPTRRPRPRPRAIRPQPEALEGRQLLARMVSGTDIDGDTWTLRLVGPGDLRVTTQNDANGTPMSLATRALINTIEVAGADPNSTRLVGTVHKAASGDGKVFFQKLTEIGGPSLSGGGNNGLKSIDIPDFYLGYTDPNTKISTTNTPTITVPDGVNSLRFGGVDTTAFFGSTPANGPTQATQNLDYLVNLGLPRMIGTSIIVKQVVSSAQPGTATSTTPATPIQEGVTINVSGRINAFQANEIVGNAAIPSSGFQGGGGTLVVSSPNANASLVGDIGNIRVGGNATNFSVQSAIAIAGSGGRVQSYYVGGEANNVQLLTPGGARTVSFGRGMDNATIRTHFIETLSANRGALNSTVTADRNIDHVIIGGDVVNTKVLSGYAQNLVSIVTSQTAPTTNPTAEFGGRISAHVAGDVKDSVFAASVEPGPDGFFGGPQDLVFPFGHIDAKVEGAIINTNSSVVVNTSNTAFFAKQVELKRGPVVPPSVPEPPFPRPTLPHQAIGLHGNGTTTEATGITPAVRAAALRQARVSTATAATTPAATHAAAKPAAAPKGPAAKFARKKA